MMKNRVCLPLRVVTYDSITFAGRGTFTFVLCFSPWRRSSEVSYRFLLGRQLFWKDISYSQKGSLYLSKRAPFQQKGDSFQVRGHFFKEKGPFQYKGYFSSQEHFLPVRENFFYA